MADTTKKLLAEKLKELLEIKPLDKVTVCELTERCGLNRQTFYYHFQDMYDLVGWIYVTESIEAIGRNIAKDGWQGDVLELFRYLKDNEVFVTNTYHSLSKDHLQLFLENQIERILLNAMSQMEEHKNLIEEDMMFIATFYKYGISGVVLDWIKSDMKEKPQDMVIKLDLIISGNLKTTMIHFVESKEYRVQN